MMSLATKLSGKPLFKVKEGKTLIDDISDEDWLDEDKNCMINVGLPKKETK